MKLQCKFTAPDTSNVLFFFQLKIVNIFLHSPQKTYVVVLIRSTSVKCSNKYFQCMFHGEIKKYFSGTSSDLDI